ncbi:hypothetical protein N7481_001186 [Penicillium waksmanii]|uniref:uncharacterized protein n=1 Tax=Penicillium waksmanii TaxID=69791 RepID=UPI00254694D7|nr:uncharacterized protein N7481_001186 [Penicillium waksmanii]KAJ6000777.1 hypothetical protein N7481_001186 [Penicillium waksmanii]
MSSPTVDAFFNRLGSIVTIGFLTIWILATIGFIYIDVEGSDWNLFETFLSISLFTYLIFRMIVACTNTKLDSIVYRLTTAHRRSRRGALAVLVCACSWIYGLFFKILTLFLVNGFCIMMLSAHLYPDLFDQLDELSLPDSESPGSGIEVQNARYRSARYNKQEYFDAIEQMKMEADFDPVQALGWIPLRILLCCFALLWFSCCTLTLYVLRLCWKSIRVAFGPSSSPSTPPKTHVV